MVRPHKERRVEQLPPVTHYKPAGIPLRSIEEVILTVEEMEAIRLADMEQLDQAAAAERMEISRPTFHRIVNAAHQKIATALWQGQALRVDGGNFRVAHRCQTGLRDFSCQSCGYKWSLPRGNGQRCRDLSCPACQSPAVSRDDE
ncbi:Hypothetical protein LUCI_5044 [Lucifera butyrica]|uniref:UPF0251 protein LUCI_5044 n=1 Tax=Lucifera butyrica TaxID=1351585 RepID=A0A498RAJ5_9FIRM|nr:DUF134 domain-containing protein [Lucifera butyrica]VBB09746.1 Hypothetical protein LUCI_5044 [Lucifera butyrica]